MASPQPTDSHTRISNELYTQILMRDFTKRQRAILDLIIRLSYGCGKKTAYIRMNQFKVCGVDKYHIKKELKSLHKLNIIGWDENEFEFWIQKDYDLWEVDPPSEEIRNEMNFLIRENIKDSYQNGNLDSEPSYQNGNCDAESYQNGNQAVTKTVTKELPKWEPKKSETPCATWLEEVSITKDNYKDIEKIKDQKIKDSGGVSQTKILIQRKYEQTFSRFPNDVQLSKLEKFVDKGMSIELVYIALEKTRIKGRDLYYTIGILNKQLDRGIKNVAQAEIDNAQFEAAAAKKRGYTDVRKPSSGSSTETDEEWEVMESNYFARSKDPL